MTKSTSRKKGRESFGADIEKQSNVSRPYTLYAAINQQSNLRGLSFADSFPRMHLHYTKHSGSKTSQVTSDG